MGSHQPSEVKSRQIVGPPLLGRDFYASNPSIFADCRVHVSAGMFESHAAVRQGRGSAPESYGSLKACSRGQGVEAGAALAFAMAGDTARGESLAQNLGKRLNERTLTAAGHRLRDLRFARPRIRAGSTSCVRLRLGGPGESYEPPPSHAPLRDKSHRLASRTRWRAG
jgi:hypothetical protein